MNGSLSSSRNGTVVLAGGLFLALAVMIVPVPTGLLDLSLTFNIAFALTILLVTLYTREPLDLSVFPSLLLLTTLLRLALNVASTRLILSDGYAGKVIASFGQFVVSGNPIIGLVIFFILIVIQFVVITRGAGRVAEVSARFTLDALPGKQMGIDADLNAGLIDETEARRRRDLVTREADFYGSMDGASKFVRGDAVAGVVITLINISGGFAIGVAQRGLSFGEALHTYTLLTVGDGLVTQIPALVISVAAGILVTRAVGAHDFARDLFGQVFLHPPAILVTSGMLAVLGIVPGLPTVPFLVLAALAAGLGVTTARRVARRERVRVAADASTPEPASRLPVDDLLVVDLLEIEIGDELVSLVESSGDLLEHVPRIRRRVASELGFILPPVRIRDHRRLPPNEYRILVKGVPVGRGEIHLDRLLAMNPGHASGELRGIEVREPTFGAPAVWIDPATRDDASASEWTIVEPAAVVATHLSEIVTAEAPELLGRQETKDLLDGVKGRASAVVEELIPGLLTLGEVQKVLAGLLRERVSIRDLVTILETLADHARTDREVDHLVELCRAALGRAICDSHRNPDGTLAAVTLSASVESLLGDSIDSPAGPPALSPEVSRSLVGAIHSLIERAVAGGSRPVILTSGRLRNALRRLIEPLLPHVAVLSLSEIAAGTQVTSLGMVRLDDE